jgi:hypothetical protein
LTLLKRSHKERIVTKQEARDLIGNRKGWLGIEEYGEYSEYSFHSRRPLTTEAYRLSTEAEREKAIEILAGLNLRGCTAPKPPEGGRR